MKGKGGHSNFKFFGELPFPQHAAGVVGTLNCCAFLYNSGILSTMIFIFGPYWCHIIFTMSSFCVCVCVHFHYFSRTLYMYYMCLTSLTGSMDDRTV